VIGARLRSLSGPAALALWGWLAAAWLASALGGPPPRRLAQAVLALAALALATWCVERLRRAFPDLDPAAARQARWWVVALLGLACLTFFTGLQREPTGRYFADEGTYLNHAQQINGGRLLRPWFVYPHLLFYLDAFALWLAGLLGRAWPALARLVWGVEGDPAFSVLATRCVTAACGALTLLPVSAAARRLGGLAAAGLAAAAIALSPTYVEVAHLSVSDVPAGLFAALTFAAAAALLGAESRRGYLAGGAAAGLAAGSKYPAGLAAVALAAVYLHWRLGDRRLRPGLFWAALAAIAAFLLSTPSLLAFPLAVYRGGGTDILYGLRQYALGGWAGVVHASNTAYYGRELVHALGWPLIVLGAAGFVWRCREARRLAAWLLPFPVLYLGLVVSLQVAVRRNLFPALPALAALLAAGAAGWLALARRAPSPAARRLLPVAIALLCLAPIALTTAGWLARTLRPTTREEAAAWIAAHLPPGSSIVQEQYTPRLGPAFTTRHPRFVSRLTPAELRDPRHDFVFLASDAYERFFRTDDPANQDREAPGRYREIFERCEVWREWTPGRFQDGPKLSLYKLDPEAPVFAAGGRFAAAAALVESPAMLPAGATRVRALEDGKWTLFKAHLAPGAYLARLQGKHLDGARIEVRTRDNARVSEASASPEGAHLTLPRADKYFLYVYLPAGGRLRALSLTPAPS
jgi:hypothetical protein